MGKVKSIKPGKLIPEVEEIEKPYEILHALKITELVFMVNHWILVKGYLPIGGAAFSDQLGMWHQTVIKKGD